MATERLYTPRPRAGRGLAVPLVVAAMAVGCIMLWTGIPLAWLRIAGLISSVGYVAYAVALTGCVATMGLWGWGLARLNRVYLRLRGREPEDAYAAWRRGARRETSLLDAMIVIS